MINSSCIVLNMVQPEKAIYSYTTEGPEDPRAIRKFRPRGEVDMDYVN